MSAEGKKFCPEAATDVELLNRVAEHGCDLAFQELIHRHAGLVRRVVGGVLKGQCPVEDRKDVEQEVWKRIWQYRRAFDTGRGHNVAALIRRIAQRAALSYVLRSTKKSQIEAQVDHNNLDIIKAPESVTQWLRDSPEEQSFVVFDLIDRVLSEIKDEHATLVMAIITEPDKKKTYKDFAKRFNTTESNVKQIMFRFKNRYMNLLSEYRKGNAR